MTYREFIDFSGARWRVWGTAPVADGTRLGAARGGWLTFETADGVDEPPVRQSRWHLGPLPEGWEDFSDAMLESLCRFAQGSPRPAPLTEQRPSPSPGE
ncbi:MAG: hypothetical protein NVS4B3_04780 [Gemmatimonadaceae bacterium]